MVKKNKIRYWDNGMSQAEDIILRCFFPEGNEITIRDMSKKTDYSYERINTALKKLEKKEIIIAKKVGRTLLFKADYHNLYLKLAFHHYMTERLIQFKECHPQIFKAVKEIEECNKTDIVLVFGSYSKRTETKNSDIDLLVSSINRTEIEKIVNRIKYKYGLKINLSFVKRTEFMKIKKENSELWKDLKLNALVFWGQDLFYYWIYKHENN